MLPHRLSSDLCSLVEGEDRLALSLFLEMDEDGEIRSHRFERTWIRTDRRLDYVEAHRVLSGEASVDPLTDSGLRHLTHLASKLREHRIARGSLDFDLPEARVVLDEDGMPVDIVKSEQLDSHRLIEDFMIAANEVVAREAELRGLPIPYRIHEPPSKDRLLELREFLVSIGHPLPKGRVGPKTLQRLLDQTENGPESGLVSSVVLRAMSRARYDRRNLGHFGLASRAYTHFTSPIRRYPDLVLHRVVTRMILDREPSKNTWDEEFLDTMTGRASEQERVAERAERDSVALKKVEFMSRHLGDTFEGTISGVTSFGFFVLLDRYFVDGLVHVSALEDDYYRFVPESYSLEGERGRRRFRLGDRVTVQVARVSKEERQIDFVLA
jgi:ribonuclease R